MYAWADLTLQSRLSHSSFSPYLNFLPLSISFSLPTSNISLSLSLNSKLCKSTTTNELKLAYNTFMQLYIFKVSVQFHLCFPSDFSSTTFLVFASFPCFLRNQTLTHKTIWLIHCFNSWLQFKCFLHVYFLPAIPSYSCSLLIYPFLVSTNEYLLCWKSIVCLWLFTNSFPTFDP